MFYTYRISSRGCRRGGICGSFCLGFWRRFRGRRGLRFLERGWYSGRLVVIYRCRDFEEVVFFEDRVEFVFFRVVVFFFFGDFRVGILLSLGVGVRRF